MLLATEEEVCILRKMFCEIKNIVFKMKICPAYVSNINEIMKSKLFF